MSSVAQKLIVGISRVFCNAVFYKQTSSKILSLTIDDVGGEDTREILTVINLINLNIAHEEEKIRATFFIISEKVKDFSILQEILNQGHEIGNHGDEDHFHAFLPPSKFRIEINKTHQKLTSETVGAEIKWFRPGRGLYNCCMLNILKEMLGYYDKFALASMLPLDTFPITSNPRCTIKYVSKFIFPGSILLLHGGSPERSANTSEVLKTLLPQLKEQKYKVVTLTELFES